MWFKLPQQEGNDTKQICENDNEPDVIKKSGTIGVVKVGEQFFIGYVANSKTCGRDGKSCGYLTDW